MSGQTDSSSCRDTKTKNLKVSVSEANDKSTDERIYRRERRGDGPPIKGKQPGKAAESGLQHEGDPDPTGTSYGAHSVARQAKRNKKHPERFAEAIAFLRANQGKPIKECATAIAGLHSRRPLRLLVTKLLSGPGVDRDWLYQLKQYLERPGAFTI